MANATCFGVVGEFDSEKEEINAYCERFELFFEANGITEAKQRRAIFLASVGPQLYKLIRTLSGNKPDGKTYQELKELVLRHLKPRPNIISQRYRFFRRDRTADESVSEYIAALRDLSEFCEFGTQLDVYLRDRFVCGINEQKMLQKLLSISDASLTLEKALECALAIEAVTKDSKLIQGFVQGETVLKLSSSKLRCYRCGDSRHLADKCPQKSKVCYSCKKPGHLKKNCRERQGEESERTTSSRGCNRVDADVSYTNEPQDEDGYLELSALSLYMLKNDTASRKPVFVSVKMNKELDVDMELDTGAAVSVMSKESFLNLPGEKGKLVPTKLKLRTYTGETVIPLGIGQVDVALGNQELKLPITVVDGKVPTLMGRDWLQKLKLDWGRLFPVAANGHGVNAGVNKVLGNSPASINKLDVKSEVDKLIKEFPTVFTEKLGCFTGHEVEIPIADDAKPKYFKPRRVSYALLSRVEEELEKLEMQGVWQKVNYSKWAAPIVTVLKDPQDPSGPIRICGDYKLTVNRVAPLDNYPVPSVTDQLATLEGAVVFSKLDLSQAYQQLPLDEKTRELLTVSTHRGLYRPFRLQFGVHSATGIFQRVMEQTLAGISDVKVRVDDILIGCKSDREMLNTLRAVLMRLRTAGFTVNWKKCKFFEEEVIYCGHIVSSKGVKPILSNVDAILKAPEPKNVTEVKAFLGMVNYYNMFMKDLATVAAPMHALLRKGAKWEWSVLCQRAFDELKNMMVSAPILTHFDSKKEIIVHADASPYGVGAVLSHVMPNGQEKPVCFASRTLTSAERNYAHIEKEGLSVIFAIKKFHQYLFGYKFTIFTDHKPLLGLFGESKALPGEVSGRILRWALLLSAYNYVLKYRPGVDHANCDGISRLPLPLESEDDVSTQVVSVQLLDVDCCPVSEEEVRELTRREPVMSKLLRVVLQGWNGVADPELRDFRLHSSELCTEGGCVLWGSRVVIPRGLQERVLKMLHEMHPGMSRMKALARSYVWWPRIDSDIEALVRSCVTCLEHQKNPASAPVHPWEQPFCAWQRLHIDFAEVLKMYFLIVVDVYSRWLEVVKVAGTSTKETVNKLRSIFATHGLPEVIVSDNGPAFISEDYKKYLKLNGISNMKTAPYHPSSNGPVERYVQTFKIMFKKATECGDVSEKLDRLLFSYRTTPHSVSGLTPAELLMKRKLRTRLDMLRPNPGGRRKSLVVQSSSKLREFQVGDEVMAKNFGKTGGKWWLGSIAKRMGATNYVVRLDSGQLVHRHVDQILSRSG